MRDLLYYPGCSLKDTAKGFESSAMAVSEDLEINLKELSPWNCCGTVYSLAEDNLMKQLAPVRNLIRVQDRGENSVYTMCAMCFNTLKRANSLVREDSEKLEKINAFMDLENDYDGSVEVKHLLELLRDEMGLDAVSEQVKRPLAGRKVAPYYGCMLTRPAGVGVEDPHDPQIFDQLIRALGGEAVEYPYRTECCGSYNTVDHRQAVSEKVGVIVQSALEHGAETIITGCPLCHYNLDTRQADLLEQKSSLTPLPVLYFTQLMALAFGLPDSCRFDDHAIDPRPVLNTANAAPKR